MNIMLPLVTLVYVKFNNYPLSKTNPMKYSIYFEVHNIYAHIHKYYILGIYQHRFDIFKKSYYVTK